MKLRNIVGALAAGILFSGCTTTITNLTPGSLPRSGDHLYPVEVLIDTQQATMRENTLEASVLIGTEVYPMRPVPMLKNRFEAAIPVSPATNYVYYRYKFDYLYDRVAAPGKSSRLSPTYQLEIVDK
jgi:hypothetical protein